MLIKKVGTYRENRDFGFHIEAVDKEGPRRFQSVMAGLLTEEEQKALQRGETVSCPFFKPEDFLARIAS